MIFQLSKNIAKSLIDREKSFLLIRNILKIDFSEKSAAVSYTNLNDVKHYFVNELDSDGDGYLDRKELSKWVQPDGFQGVSKLK